MSLEDNRCESETSSLRLFCYRELPVGMPRLGILLGDRHFDLFSYTSLLGIELPFDPFDLQSLIASGETGLRQLNDAAQSKAIDCAALRPESIELLAPIRPRNALYAVGWNYVDHFFEGKDSGRPNTPTAYPEHPVLFCKTANTVCGPYAAIPSHASITSELDWEVELAVIIGRTGRDILPEDALRHVFGYTVINDVTARDIQQRRHGGQWVKGKSLDGSAPMGPYVVLAKDFEIRDQVLSCSVNGTVVQQAKLSDMYFKIPQIIAELSRGLTLVPGDIILTGTPSGVGHYRKPPQYLKPGDLLESSIEGIGTMKNQISA